jgi:thymidylate synthase ThyX
MARAVLPMGHLTRFYASANIRNWKHFCDLRISPDAQQEIRELAQAVSDELNNLYPNTWKALNNVAA